MAQAPQHHHRRAAAGSLLSSALPSTMPSALEPTNTAATTADPSSPPSYSLWCPSLLVVLARPRRCHRHRKAPPPLCPIARTAPLLFYLQRSSPTTPPPSLLAVPPRSPPLPLVDLRPPSMATRSSSPPPPLCLPQLLPSLYLPSLPAFTSPLHGCSQCTVPPLSSTHLLGHSSPPSPTPIHLAR